MGTPMEVCDEGFVHPDEDCRARARARRGKISGGRHSVTPTATAMATDLQKQARVSAQLSDRRMSTVRGCLDGRCSLRDDATAAKMVCRGGCGRTLHQRCADISNGRGAWLVVASVYHSSVCFFSRYTRLDISTQYRAAAECAERP